MTICVSVKTRDGIVLGTDSMSTVTLYGNDGQSMAQKTYSNARKLVQIGSFPIGVFIYGTGNLGPRTVYSHILEYSRSLENDREWTVQKIASGLSQHMMQEYNEIYGETKAQHFLGLNVAGYSKGVASSEEWKIGIPSSIEPGLVMTNGVNWEGILLPFGRLYQGYDLRLIQALQEAGVKPDLLRRVLEETPLVPQILFDAMPLQDAINYVVYVLRTTIGFSSFETGPPTCGGQLQIAVISEEDGFQWVSRPEFRIPEDTNEWA